MTISVAPVKYNVIVESKKYVNDDPVVVLYQHNDDLDDPLDVIYIDSEDDAFVLIHELLDTFFPLFKLQTKEVHGVG